HLHRLFTLDAACTFALSAWSSDDATCTAAGVARSGDRKEPLLIANLPSTTASLTTLGCSPWRRSDAFATFTGFKPRNAQLCSHTGGGFFERYLQVVAKVGTTLCS